MKLYNPFKKIQEIEKRLDIALNEIQLLRRSAIEAKLPQYDYLTYINKGVFKLIEEIKSYNYKGEK